MTFKISSIYKQICVGLLITSQFAYASSPLHLHYMGTGGALTETSEWAKPPTIASSFLKSFSVMSQQKADLKISDETAALVYERASQLIAAEFGEKLQSGVLPFNRFLYKQSRLGYLATLQDLYERNGRKKIVIEIPEHEALKEMILSVNADMQNSGWGEFVEFKINPEIKVKLEDAFPGKQARNLETWNTTRSLLVPILSVSAAYLGVMANQVFSNPEFLAVQEGLTEVGRAGDSGVTQIEAAMRLGPVFLGTAATIAATLGLKKLSQKAQDSIAEGKATLLSLIAQPIGQHMNQHTVIGLSALATLGGTAALMGPAVVSTLIQVGMLMGAAYGLEYQFSRFSNFWDKYFWRAGWVDFMHERKLIPTFVFDKLKKSPKMTGFFTNWGVNTAYPFVLFTSLAIGATTAELLSGLTIRSGGPSLGEPYAYADVIKGALMNGGMFSAAFGLFQVMIGSLKEKGLLTESSRFKAETSAVAYNQSGRVLDAAGVSTGGYMMWAYALLVTAPTVGISLFNKQVLNRYNRKTQDAVIKQLGPNCAAAIAKAAK
jgi:hypothetical protein